MKWKILWKSCLETTANNVDCFNLQWKAPNLCKCISIPSSSQTHTSCDVHRTRLSGWLTDTKSTMSKNSACISVSKAEKKSESKIHRAAGAETFNHAFQRKKNFVLILIKISYNSLQHKISFLLSKFGWWWRLSLSTFGEPKKNASTDAGVGKASLALFFFVNCSESG